ncbi:MAG: hypothetical protein JWO38_1375 [Gemmataceae bacterium]|nr:hypothetical protein [Gemmataceae bacterium]
MIVRDGEDFLELEVTERVPEGVPCAGDIRFAVRVRITSKDTVFSAETWAWVEAPVMTTFAEQIRTLEKQRQGSAALESMSPGELRLDVRGYDRAGHIAAVGQVGHWCYGGVGGPYWSAVSFGIAFCPSELPALVRYFEGLVESPLAP